MFGDTTYQYAISYTLTGTSVGRSYQTAFDFNSKWIGSSAQDTLRDILKLVMEIHNSAPNCGVADAWETSYHPKINEWEEIGITSLTRIN